MGWTSIKYSKWVELMETSANPREYNGISPGGLAEELGITRQSIHKAIDRGDLDAWRIEKDKSDTLVAIVVKTDSVERYKTMRKLRQTG